MPRLDPATARLSVRPPRDAEEMRGVLETRFDVYSATEGVCNFKSLDPATGLDLCPYDSRAHHLALILEADGETRVVGSMRVVMDQVSPQAELLTQALAPYPRLRDRFLERLPAPLPMLSYLVQAPVVRVEYDRCVAAGQRVAEPSRLAVRPEARRLAARQGFSAGTFMVEAALAYGFFVVGLDRVFLDCDGRTASLYLANGFEDHAGAGPIRQPDLGFEVAVLVAAPASIPASVRPRVEAMAEQFRREGAVCARSMAHACVARVAA